MRDPFMPRHLVGTPGSLLCAAVALVLHAAPSSASVGFQRGAQAPGSGSAASGWVGLQVEFVARSAAEAQSGRYTVVIEGVDPGGPAWAAGIQPGDTLLHIGGSAASPSSFQALRRGLRVGDALSVEIARGAVRRELSLVAAPRPVLAVGTAPGSLVVRIDSLRGVILRNADSLRKRSDGQPVVLTGSAVVATGDGSPVTVLELSRGQSVTVGGGNVTVRSDNDRHTITWTYSFEEPGIPEAFETRIVRAPSTDSLRRSIDSLRDELELVERAASRRHRELVRVEDGAGSDAVRTDDAQLRQLEAVRSMLAGEIAAQEAALRDVSRKLLSEESAAPPPIDEPDRIRVRTGVGVAVPAPNPAPPPPKVRVHTALTPYVVGRNYLAGAEVASLNPRLATYFAVERGVLVTQVAPQTPADQAGLTPGDVIVAVDDRPVRTVEQLRDRLSQRWDGTRLSVVRKGEDRELVLRRW